MPGLLLAQFPSHRDAVPFGQTAAAAGGSGVLGDENQMAAHGRLPAVMARLSGRQALTDELASMLQDHGQSLFDQISLFLLPRPEMAAKLAHCHVRPRGGGNLNHFLSGRRFLFDLLAAACMMK
jgi:hypothetical protein